MRMRSGPQQSTPESCEAPPKPPRGHQLESMRACSASVEELEQAASSMHLGRMQLCAHDGGPWRPKAWRGDIDADDAAAVCPCDALVRLSVARTTIWGRRRPRRNAWQHMAQTRHSIVGAVAQALAIGLGCVSFFCQKPGGAGIVALWVAMR